MEEGKSDKKAPNGEFSAVAGSRSMSVAGSAAKPVAVARPMAKAAVVGVVEPRDAKFNGKRYKIRILKHVSTL